MSEPFHGEWDSFADMVCDRISDMETSGYVNIKVTIDEGGKFDVTGDLCNEQELEDAIIKEAMDVTLLQLRRSNEMSGHVGLIPIEELDQLRKLCLQYKRMKTGVGYVTGLATLGKEK